MCLLTLNEFNVIYIYIYSFPGGSMVKNLPLKWRSHRKHSFIPWVGKILCSGKWQPNPAFFPRESHGQKSSSWGSQRVDNKLREHACMYKYVYIIRLIIKVVLCFYFYFIWVIVTKDTYITHFHIFKKHTSHYININAYIYTM